MNILYELYNGNIVPSEKFVKKGSEYKMLLERLAELSEELAQKFDENDRKIWGEIWDTETTMERMGDRESFVDGFCIGARLMLEIMTQDRTDRNVL